MRRWRLWLLLGLALPALAAGGAVWAASQASRVQADLLASRDLLGRAATLGAEPPARRSALVEQAGAHARRARARLDRWPLRQLGSLPLAGRDVRVARAVSDATVRVVDATRGVAAALGPLLAGPPTRATITRTSGALLALGDAIDGGAARVRATRPLLVALGPRATFLRQAEQAGQVAGRAGQGLRLAATLYGPAGSARWFLAFQNPAELRGTGGLIGQYGILESDPRGPRLTRVETYVALEQRTRARVALPAEVERRYGRFGTDRLWSAVNIPPDLPTVGRIVLELYRRTTGTRIDGMIAADPLAVAGILGVSGPITVEGSRLDAGNVAAATMVDAYVRYRADNQARRAFLEKTALATFAAFRQALGRSPDALVRALAVAARGRHLQVYSSDPAAERALLELGIGGDTAAPPAGDYLLPVTINTGGNKLDAFLHRTLRYRVRLGPDGGARTSASITLRNDSAASGLPRYILGPYDARFRAGENYQFQTLYVAGAYGFTAATRDGRRVGAEAQAELGGLAISQEVAIPPGRSVTLAYELERRDALLRAGDRASYRLLVRPQPTVHPDQLEVAVQAPPGWRPRSAPPGFRQRGGELTWSGPLDRPRTFQLEFAKG